jgi:hypothetical protein
MPTLTSCVVGDVVDAIGRSPAKLPGGVLGSDLLGALLGIQSDIACERRPVCEPQEETGLSTRSPSLVFDPEQEEGADGKEEALRCRTLPISTRDLTCCFLRLSNADNGAFDRLGRYNATLWKQTAQTLFLLQTIRRPLL